MGAEFEGDVIILGNVDVKLRMFKNKVILLEGQIKTLTSQLAEETQRAEEQREEIRKLRGKIMSNGKLTNAAIRRRNQAQAKRANRQAETQLSPFTGMTETSGSESISA